MRPKPRRRRAIRERAKAGRTALTRQAPLRKSLNPFPRRLLRNPLATWQRSTLEDGRNSEVLVDTGAGSHLFVKGFDPKSKVVGDSGGRGLVTVTGEPLTTGPKRQSVVQARDGQSFSIEYNESEKINFSVLSSGQAATKGCWTIIGPNKHCLVLDKNAEKVREALKGNSVHPTGKETWGLLAAIEGQCEGTQRGAGSSGHASRQEGRPG